MDKFSYLGVDVQTIEAMYEEFRKQPDSVEESWQKFFGGFEFALKTFSGSEIYSKEVDKEFKVINLIFDYRKRGHFFTKTNPVRTRRKYLPTLDIENFGLETKDLETEFLAGKEIGIGKAKLKDIISHLELTYCQSVGVEYQYIREVEVVNWLQEKMEKSKNSFPFSVNEQKDIFSHLNNATGFERFIHKKFIGQKRFSLEGTETLIPAMDAAIEKGSELGIEEFVIAMSHRGRLNVLANILKKPFENIFKEFMGNEYEEGIVFGDVKYHLGYSNEIVTDSGKNVKLNLAPNPSHLEASSGVVQGIARARVKKHYGNNFDKCAVIIIHGDAAIATQGVVYEVVQMSQLEGYKTGGTIHLVINNQVGFTTSYTEARSSTYCTDIAKVIKSPVFHVNGDDVEALVYTLRFALEFRQSFHRDVFIDILSYRKYGHNEGDEPRFTQPTLYKAIASHPNPREIYGNHLTEIGVYTTEEMKKLENDFEQILETKFQISNKMPKVRFQRFLAEDWKEFRFTDDADFGKQLNTSVDKNKILEIASKINTLPDDKKFFNKIIKIVEDRKKMIAENYVDWTMAELLAYGTLVSEGNCVRLSGQDSVRGTFSNRHASFVVEDSDQKVTPLKTLDNQQADFNVYNSHLSEYGVLGFEYGYSLATPSGLTIWEAQFGDFHNVAQVIIDQYISSAEDKWGLMNGLVLYLPHGYEGQGPEHSSARIERFLQLCANNNMQVANCTTPANLFHLLRLQVKRNFRIPLILFTPKSLLRHPKCISSLDALCSGKFHEVIDDNYTDVEKVTRLVFCSGKIYYELLETKLKLDAKDLAIVRIEQIYPFPTEEVNKIIDRYPNVLLHIWIQEEPENMGAWNFIRNQALKVQLEPVTRIASGSPAVGLHELHVLGQNEILRKIFRKCDCELLNNYCGLQCVVGKSREVILQQHRYL